MMHLVDNVEACVSLYERIEPYEAFGEELREAYLELKHIRQDHSAPSHPSPSPTDQSCSEQSSTSPESEVVSDAEQQIGHDVLSALERSVGHADFPARLEAVRRAQQEGRGSETPELDELLGDYVLVSKQDAVDAMAAFIAAYIAVLPEAQSMDSRKLQRALLTSIQELRTSRLKSVWQWGKYLYRGAAFAYSTFAVYQNPWLIRAVVTALWTTTHLLYGMLV